MIGAIKEIMGALPPLRERKDPTVGCIVGLLVGGVGLAIYMWSFIDFVIPVAIAVATTVIFGDVGFIAGAIIAGLYGYFRIVDSNERLANAAAPQAGFPAH